LQILSKIGYQDVNETDDGRFKIISQYIRKALSNTLNRGS